MHCRRLLLLCLVWVLNLLATNAYPRPNLASLAESQDELKYKETDLGFPQPDIDVIELEHLKRNLGDINTDTESHKTENNNTQQQKLEEPNKNNDNVAFVPNKESKIETNLEQESMIGQVQTTASARVEPEQTQNAPTTATPIAKSDSMQLEQLREQSEIVGLLQLANEESRVVPVDTKSKAFYGAARLAFGQNPEVLPTTTTVSTTIHTTTTTASTSTMAKNNEGNLQPTSNTVEGNVEDTQGSTASVGVKLEQNIGVSLPQNLAAAEATKTFENAKTDDITKEMIGELAAEELGIFKSAQRRSQRLVSPKVANNLLKLTDGQYSPFDMSQYIFWTGDEPGVARAVEELVEQGLMSNENAIAFLRDIRTGIEYLQKSYANRVFPDEIRHNNVKKNYLPASTQEPNFRMISTTEQNPETQKIRNVYLSDSMDSISLWNKIQDLKNEGRQDLTDADEGAGRAKIKEFLYKEYTLEEILYKLAKVMFTQSLAHGSDEAQHELQKLTNFLEEEGNRGVIPIDLQKKVLHVLLTALSDTLSEHPELLPAARLSLINPYKKLQAQAFGLLK